MWPLMALRRAQEAAESEPLTQITPNDPHQGEHVEHAAVCPVCARRLVWYGFGCPLDCREHTFCGCGAPLVSLCAGEAPLPDWMRRGMTGADP